ncbi:MULTISPECIES: DUF3052 domain-containing protein [unclassified Streptomyces]|uniref:DUF3052 domain-containing protein n=1 Tax=unclassified Streptomyces TaxID=2593676 RepID=UPI00224DADC9|nr:MULTISPECIES: DUF3052 domain-containing protein [unclassified Streptomyces]MCX4989433.1 DUF3052 domain-containing protein [Streptomyces sp. NBC_00568]MCX5005345.1 DUF3052 domain-containing protein [Streptomyces sp. NBC_00638]
MTGSSTAGGGYSGTPLARKIGIKAGQRVRLTHGPRDWEIPGLPEDCEVEDGGPEGADVTVAFFRERAELAARAAELVRDLSDGAMLWLAWPRRAAGHVSDITENDLRDLFLPLGVVDVKVAALGEDWSGLKFVRRKENRRS